MVITSKGPTWKATEVLACVTAYMRATDNPVLGTDQTQASFVDDILSRLKHLAPPDLEEEAGTYHFRGTTVWSHLRDSVFKDVQKFNEALRQVYVSVPTGTTEQNKINMAVAIHKKKTKLMDYSYCDFDPMVWKHYTCWLALKDIPKFAYGAGDAAGDAAGAEAGAEDGNATDDCVSRHERSRGGGSGTKKAKAAKLEEEARKSNENNTKMLTQEITLMRKANESKLAGSKRTQDMMFIKTGLREFNDDPVMKSMLRGQLKTLLLNNMDSAAATTSDHDDSDDNSNFS